MALIISANSGRFSPLFLPSISLVTNFILLRLGYLRCLLYIASLRGGALAIVTVLDDVCLRIVIYFAANCLEMILFISAGGGIVSLPMEY
jgi:hypothetical protein